MNTNILIGETAEQVVFEILQSNNSQNGNYPAHTGAKGYYKDDDGVYVAFDNSTNDCWIEEFNTRKEALKWLNDEE